MSSLQFAVPAPVVSRPQFLAPARPVSIKLAASRAFDSNPNHHLWKNGRLWWIAFTLIHDGYRQERVRQSLGTDNLSEARRRRDSILALFNKPEADCCIDPGSELDELATAVNG
jgi:hypothetical protein